MVEFISHMIIYIYLHVFIYIYIYMGIPRIVGNHFEEARLVDFLSSIFRLVDTGDRRDPTKTDLMT